MLAQNFKTPADLGITDAEFDAPHQVLRGLERNELTHARGDGYGAKIEDVVSFNMNEWICGTCACIGGWAEILGCLPLNTLDTRSRELLAGERNGLHQLFFPDTYVPKVLGKLGNITTAQAAVALRNYLTHGEPRWDEALAVT